MHVAITNHFRGLIKKVKNYELLKFGRNNGTIGLFSCLEKCKIVRK